EAFDEEIPRFKESHPSAITSLAVSSDGRRALAGMKDGAIWLWDVEGGTLLRRCQGLKEPVTCLAFSPDGRRWLSGDKQGIILQGDTESGKELHRCEGHRDAIEALSFAKNGKQSWLISVGGGADATLRRWDPEKCIEVEQRRLSKTTAHVFSAAIALDGK